MEHLLAAMRTVLADPELAEYALVVALIALVSYVAMYVH
jgi:hypothetical protein